MGHRFGRLLALCALMGGALGVAAPASADFDDRRRATPSQGALFSSSKAPTPRSVLPDSVIPDADRTPVARPSPLSPPSAPVAADAAAECGPNAIGPSRTVALDTTGGPHFGRHDRYGVPDFLGPKEVVLTFDDGPRPGVTRRILRTLAEHCVKATFFVVGQTARWRPDILKETAAAGHTIAGHTDTHPIPFDGLPHAEAVREIERGFREVERKLGGPVAPFFRFPGLAYTHRLLDYLSGRDVTALSVDVISDDTARGATAQSIVTNTFRRLRRHGNGILLYHDTLKRTADALPVILRRLKAEGYRVVHLEPTKPVAPPGEQPDPAPGVQLITSAALPTADTGRAPTVVPAPPAPAPRAWRKTLYKRPAWRAIEPPALSAIF